MNLSHTPFHWRDLNPFAKPPTTETLVNEEIEELQNELYLIDKQRDHYHGRAQIVSARLAKLRTALQAAKEQNLPLY